MGFDILSFRPERTAEGEIYNKINHYLITVAIQRIYFIIDFSLVSRLGRDTPFEMTQKKRADKSVRPTNLYLLTTND